MSRAAGVRLHPLARARVRACRLPGARLLPVDACLRLPRVPACCLSAPASRACACLRAPVRVHVRMRARAYAFMWAPARAIVHLRVQTMCLDTNARACVDVRMQVVFVAQPDYGREGSYTYIYIYIHTYIHTYTYKKTTVS